jgi:hypothetical protein
MLKFNNSIARGAKKFYKVKKYYPIQVHRNVQLCNIYRIMLTVKLNNSNKINPNIRLYMANILQQVIYISDIPAT